MFCALLCGILVLCGYCQATFLPAWLLNGGGGGGGVGCSRCAPAAGLCPPFDCLKMEAVTLGYCCGCAIPRDHLPMVCPREPACPPDVDELCRHYSFYVDCCCPATYRRTTRDNGHGRPLLF